MLFEKDTFDVAESRLFLPYRIFESSKRQTELTYKYTNYKEQGYYRCNYEKGKLKSRVLYLDSYNHVFPWSVLVKNGRVSSRREKLLAPLKQASYFTQIAEGHIEEKAFRADTFLQMVNYFMANGRIDSVKISRGAYSLNYSVTYDSSGRLLTVQAVENGKSYVAQKRVYKTYTDDYSYVSIVKDTLFGYSAYSTTSVASDSIPRKAFFVDYTKDTSYIFAASHTFFYDNSYTAKYEIYRIQNGTFLEPERSLAFPTYNRTLQECQRVNFVKRTVGNKRFETFCPEPFPLSENSSLWKGGYTLQRNEKKKGHFSIYTTSQDQFGSCEYPSVIDSNKIMEVLVR